MKMDSRKVYIITEGSRELGMGHISRCLTFYDRLQEVGFEVEMLIDGDESCNIMLGYRSHKFVSWHKNQLTLDVANGQILFVDSLTITQQEVDYIQSLSPHFVIIDDYQRNTYKHALVIDWTPNVECTNKHIHNNNGRNVLLLGVGYSVIRKQFVVAGKHIYRKLQTITIIMGGADVRCLSTPISKKLLEEYPEYQINVVVGAASSSDVVISNKNLSIYKALDADRLKDLFLDSDIVITAGGQTLFELAALNVPAIPIQVIDNQEEDLSGMLEQGFFDEIFQWDDSELMSKLCEKINSLASIEARMSYVGNFSEIGIGKGLNKIVDEIISFCNESN